MSNLTKEKLEKYIKSNTDYYEKYRKKFNKKNNFLSWNWSFFFFIPWLAYRKLWDFYITYIFISIAYATIFYKLLTAPRDVSPTIMIVVGGITQALIIFTLLTANNRILKHANENRDPEGRSSSVIVVFATLLLMTPPTIAMAMYYPIYKTNVDKNTIFHISEDEKDMSQLLKKIEGISDGNTNSYLISKVVCYDNIELLKAIETKNAEFKNKHLEEATKCEALKSVKFLLSKGTRANEDNYKIIQNAIVYNRNIPLAKLLLENENKMSEGANAQILIEQAINLKDSKERKAFIEYLVDKKINIYNTKDKDRNNYNNKSSALYEAIIKSDFNTTKLLLEKGANPNQRYSYGRTPLYKALYEANIEIMQLLLEHKADVDLIIENEETALDNTVQKKQLDKTKLLLKYKATVSAKTLDLAMKSGDDKLIALIGQQKNKGKLSKEAVAKLFATACENKSTDAIDILLKQGYDINSSKSLLFNGCSGWKDTTMFAYVISKGVDVNLFEKDDTNGRNILHDIIGDLGGLGIPVLGEKEEDPNKIGWEKIKLVIKYGVNINHQDNQKRTPLMWALSYGRDHKDVVEYLFDHADVDLTLLDENSDSLLHYVLNMPSLVEKIIKKLKKEKQLNKMIDHVNIDGSTPLHYAASGNTKVMKMLVAAGANPNTVNKNGYTPLANIETKDSYDLLKNTGNEISKKKAECSIFVKEMGQKKYQPSCLMIAKQEKKINSISYYQFLGGDITGLLKTTYDSSKGVHYRIYAYMNVGHGYVINGNIEKAKESYAEFAKNRWAVEISKEEAETMIQGDFDIISKLYGENVRKDAMTAWSAVRDASY